MPETFAIVPNNIDLPSDKHRTMKLRRTSHRKKGRAILTRNFLSARIGPCSSAAKIFSILLSINPAFFSSCILEPPSGDIQIQKQIYILKAEKPTAAHADLFFFDCDGEQALDSYLRCNVGKDGLLDGSCRTGAKTAIVITDSPFSDYLWNEIRTLDAINRLSFNLLDESPDSPAAIGKADIVPGGSGCIRIKTTPFLCTVKVNSICCDFHGKDYENEQLTGVKVYLTNVSGSCRLSGDSPGNSWYNLGGLDEESVKGMKRPWMLMKEFQQPIGDSTVFPEIILYCYPNPSDEDSFGTPVTRLVVEGSLGGTIYYYPLSLGRLDCGERRRLDIAITSKGTSDPDTPATSDMIKLVFNPSGWEEGRGGTIDF